MSNWEEDDDTNLAPALEILYQPEATASYTSSSNEDEALLLWQPQTFDQPTSFASYRGRDGGIGGEGRGRSGLCYKCNEEGHLSCDCSVADIGGGERHSEGRRGFKSWHNNRRTRGRQASKAGGCERQRPPLYIPEDIDDDKLFDVDIEIGDNFKAYDDIPVQVYGDEPVPHPEEDFADMDLHDLLKVNILHAGYKQPTPIQKHAIPILLSGHDLMACAQTGSGKTAAFLIPMLQYVIEGNIESHAYEECAQPVGLVMTPTRELALQIYYEARKFAYGSIVRCCVLYGGASIHNQLKRLKELGCHIVVTTPGRLKDVLKRQKMSLCSIKFLVLDEADFMLDKPFLCNMKKTVAHPSMPPRNQRQTLMFSATFPEAIHQCANKFLKNYIFLVVGSVGAANRDVTQEVVEVPRCNKREKLLEYIMQIQPDKEKILIFVETKLNADFIRAYLCTEHFNAVAIHGNLFQSQREEALNAFRSGKSNILVATSLAARGLDIRGVGYVINYDLPKTSDIYVHRIGRTGRVGNQGHAISFFDQQCDSALSKDLVKILNEASQVVPEWLMEVAQKSRLKKTYYGRGRSSSADIRSKGGRKHPDDFEVIENFGGPVPVTIAEEEESRD